MEITNAFILVTGIVVWAACITLAQTHSHLHNSFINTTFCIRPSTVSNIVTISDTHTYLVLSDMLTMITTDYWSYIPTSKNRISLHHYLQSIQCSLKAKYSSGYDGVSTKKLKMSNSLISKSLSYICNKSIQTGVFPYRLELCSCKASVWKWG